MLGSGLWGVCTLVSRYFCISGIVIIIILCIGLVIHVCVRVRAQLLSCVQLLVVPWTVAHQAPLSVGFSRQEYQSGLPFPSLGDLHDPGVKPASPALAGGFFTTDLFLSHSPRREKLNTKPFHLIQNLILPLGCCMTMEPTFLM